MPNYKIRMASVEALGGTGYSTHEVTVYKERNNTKAAHIWAHEEAIDIFGAEGVAGLTLSIEEMPA